MDITLFSNSNDLHIINNFLKPYGFDWFELRILYNYFPEITGETFSQEEGIEILRVFGYENDVPLASIPKNILLLLKQICMKDADRLKNTEQTARIWLN